MARLFDRLMFALGLAGYQPAAAPGGGPPPPEEEPEAPKPEAIADPELREAREQADAALGGLLAGRLDADPLQSSVARRVKGYQGFTVKAQRLVWKGTAEFWGVLSGPTGRARFDLTMVRLLGGQWAVGTFGGPDPE